MKSTLFNMVAVLFGITLIASAGVGVVNMITVEPIRLAEQKAKEAALKEVLPEFDQTTQEELVLDELNITAYRATKAGELTGIAVESISKNGFGGEIRLMVGFTTEGVINNVNVLKQSETPGLGTKMAESPEKGNTLITSVKGFNPADKKLVNGKLAVTKDQGDVDALTAATISSRAYVDAINRAWDAFKQVIAAPAASENQQTSTAVEETLEKSESQNEPEAQEGVKNE